MNRKEIAQDTLRYIQQGYYEVNGRQIDFSAEQKHSEERSVLITPEQGDALVRTCTTPTIGEQAKQTVVNAATVKAILDFAQTGVERVGVLNFASAKPGRRLPEWCNGAGGESYCIKRSIRYSAAQRRLLQG